MIKEFKKAISLLLLLAFLLPSIVKLNHHHAHIEFKDTSEKQYHEFQEKCGICTFELAVFLADLDISELQKENPTDCYFNNYNSQYNFTLSQYSFLLRAPPADKFEM
jgi:hypothetical protein